MVRPPPPPARPGQGISSSAPSSLPLRAFARAASGPGTPRMAAAAAVPRHPHPPACSQLAAAYLVSAAWLPYRNVGCFCAAQAESTSQASCEARGKGLRPRRAPSGGTWPPPAAGKGSPLTFAHSLPGAELPGPWSQPALASGALTPLSLAVHDLPRKPCRQSRI